ncbi:MAG: hypothetical protein LBF66_00885 [Holosporales bacterium]|jgi:NADH-quinone oxidoreductase subunit D|nr:hypothetical protein [Holosporales bacterium]
MQHLNFFGKSVTLMFQDEQIQRLRINANSHPFWIERQLESQNLIENIKTIGMFFDNAPFCHTLAFLQGIEHLFDVHVSPRSQYIRVIMCEGERIIEHIDTLGRIANSVGVVPLFMRTQHIREQYRQLCLELGASVDFFIPGGETVDVNAEFIAQYTHFFERIPPICDRIRSILLNSRIFANRATKTAHISANNVSALSLTGPNARASGVPFDVRRLAESEIYSHFPLITSHNGDVYARTSVRLDEVRQSLDIINECIRNLPAEDTSCKSDVISDGCGQPMLFPKGNIDLEQIEAGIYPIMHEYSAVEAPNGEFGAFLVGNGRNRLQRCKLNMPSFCAMQAFEEIAVEQDPMDIELIVASLGITL